MMASVNIEEVREALGNAFWVSQEPCGDNALITRNRPKAINRGGKWNYPDDDTPVGELEGEYLPHFCWNKDGTKQTRVVLVEEKTLCQMADELEQLRAIVEDVVHEIFLSTPISDVHWAQIRERIEPFLPESPPHDAMQVELEDAAREDELDQLRAENARLKTVLENIDGAKHMDVVKSIMQVYHEGGDVCI